MNLFGTVKILVMVTVIYGIKNTPYHPPKFLVFLAFRVTSKIHGIGSAERSWGDVKIIKSGKRSDHGSEISEKQSIMYKYACIE